MKNLEQLPEWAALGQHYQSMANLHMRTLFAQDSKRAATFRISDCDVVLDYSRNRMTQDTLSLLFKLANACKLQEKIEAQFSGVSVNTTEKRPALHTALRGTNSEQIEVNGEFVGQKISATHEKLTQFVQNIHNNNWLGCTGKPIKYIVNVGIGGSFMGPKMCVNALKDFAVSSLQFFFIASVDRANLDEVMAAINPEETLFIISSKSFSTIETLTNFKTILKLMTDRFGSNALKNHFVAVTANTAAAQTYGFQLSNIFSMWSWVGGRYSIWSAIGLPLMLQIGMQGFDDFLAGAHAMDQHVRQRDFANNLPVVMALIGIWYINFFGASTQAIIPYSHKLRHLVAYLQQVEMESNGKGVCHNGEIPNYATGPVLFGEEGIIGQHAYHQLLHQGLHLIPVDFLMVGMGDKKHHDPHHDILISSALSQAQALMQGKTWDEAYAELLNKNVAHEQAVLLAKHQTIPGNKPNNILYLDKLTPKHLGTLLALYEHKIFIQGTIWSINSFDQWGVELGKQLLPKILERMQADRGINDLIYHFEEVED